MPDPLQRVLNQTLAVLRGQVDRAADPDTKPAVGGKRHGAHTTQNIRLDQRRRFAVGRRKLRSFAHEQGGMRPHRLGQVLDRRAHPRVAFDQQHVARGQSVGNQARVRAAAARPGDWLGKVLGKGSSDRLEHGASFDHAARLPTY